MIYEDYEKIQRLSSRCAKPPTTQRIASHSLAPRSYPAHHSGACHKRGLRYCPALLPRFYAARSKSGWIHKYLFQTQQRVREGYDFESGVNGSISLRGVYESLFGYSISSCNMQTLPVQISRSKVRSLHEACLVKAFLRIGLYAHWYFQYGVLI